MPILCRRAREEDLERSDQLVVASINDLTQRHGFGPMAAAHPPEFQLFSLKDDAGGLWVAEEADEILGFAWSWVCGDLWFLAQLFVSPDHQGRSIGNELLIRTFEHAKKSGATNRALITFSFNTVLPSGAVLERVAEVVERDGVEDDAERMGVVAELRRRGREHAVARGAAQELHDLEFLAPRPLPGEVRAGPVRAPLGRLCGCAI
jgi:GNAT superfamily N-acetyltransferase